MADEERIEAFVGPALVAVGPEDDGRMVPVAQYHLPHQRRADVGGISLLPARQLIDHIDPQGITEFEEIFIGRIMAAAHGVHIHFLQQAHIHFLLCAAEGTSRLRPETMTVDALEFHLHAVDKDTLTTAHFDGAKPDPLLKTVYRLSTGILQAHPKAIQVRGL